MKYRPALESGDQLNAGDYFGATSSFGIALIDLFFFGEGTLSKNGTKEASKAVGSIANSRVLGIAGEEAVV